jgi:hypothetical protein
LHLAANFMRDPEQIHRFAQACPTDENRGTVASLYASQACENRIPAS